MFNYKTITKEQLVNLIQTSKSMDDVAKKLNVDRKTIYRLRHQFDIVNVQANSIKAIQEENSRDSFDIIRDILKSNAPKVEIQEEEFLFDDEVPILWDVIEELEEQSKKAALANKSSELNLTNNIKHLNEQLLIDESTTTHVVIPDCQVKPGVDTTYLEHIGKYIAKIKPTRIICIGDFADMVSLYNYKKENFDSAEYMNDIVAAKDAMEVLMKPIRLAMQEDSNWKPTFDLTLGNHEERISRVAKADKKLSAFISIDNLSYDKAGWTVHDFLKPVVLDDIAYCHYFTSTGMGAPIATARNLIFKKHMSCVMGHRQHWDMHREARPDGTGIVGLLAGCCYTHDEEYLGHQDNNYSRQIWVLNDINNGSFNPIPITTKQLAKAFNK